MAVVEITLDPAAGGAGRTRLVPLAATTGLILAMVNGLLRRRVLALEQIKDLRATTIEFCRRSLVQG